MINCLFSLFKRKVIKTIITCIILLVSIVVYGQNTTLSKSRSSGHYTYIYKLSNQQVIDFDTYRNKGKIKKLKQLFVQFQLVDSIATDSIKIPKLSFGNYLLVRANRGFVEGKIHNVHSFYTKLYNGDEHLVFGVYDINGKSIPNAQLRLNEKLFAYNPKTEQYSLKTGKKGGKIIISVNDQIDFLEIQNLRPKRSGSAAWRKIASSFPLVYLSRAYFGIKYKHDFGKPYNESTGYFVINKPQYLPGDTLKFKAYVLHKKFKPYRKELKINVARYGKTYQSMIIKPKRPGVFIGEIILSDSLRLDVDYDLILEKQYGKNAEMLRNKFTYKDYLLDEIKYETKLEKEKIKGNEAQVISMKVTDFNGFVLPDIQYNLIVKLIDLKSFYSDTVFVKDTLFISNGILHDNGETKIVIPDSLFQNIACNYKVEVTFTNSNFEKHFTTNEFEVDKKTFDLKLENKDNLIFANCIDCGTYIPKDIKLIGLSIKQDTIINKFIKLPFTFKPNPLVASYYLKDAFNNSVMMEKGEESNLYLSTWRSNDSIFFEAYNPRKIPAVFKFFKEKELIETTKDSVYYRVFYDKSKAPYCLIASYFWEGEAKFEVATNQIFEKDLKLEIDQPAQIYPGQKLKINVGVKNYNNEPVKQVDLTAWSVNSQFDEISEPFVPKFNTYREGPYISYFNDLGYGSNNIKYFENLFSIDSTWINRLHLDTIPYYKSRYVKDSILFYYDPIKTDIAEFAAFLFDKGNDIPIQMLYIDGQLKYYNYTSKFLPYAFTATPGYHKIKIRTLLKEIEIDSVLFKQNYKLEMVLNFKSKSKYIAVKDTIPSMTNEEKYLLRRSTFVLEKNISEPFYIWQKDNQIHLINGNVRGKILLGPFNDYQYLNAFAPEKIEKHFPFESGYDYKLSKFNVIMKENKRFKDKVIHFPQPSYSRNFGEHAINETDFLFNNGKPKNPTLEIKNEYWFIGDQNGQLSMDIKSDSSVSFIMIESLTSKKCHFFKPGTSKFSNLAPGKYLVYLVTNQFNGIALHAQIFSSTTSCYRINNAQFSMQEYPKIQYNLQLAAQENKKVEEMEKRERAHKARLDSERSARPLSLKSGYGAIKLTITDKETHETIPFVTITLNNLSGQLIHKTCNLDGEVLFTQVSSLGYYEIDVQYVGYSSVKITDVYVDANQTSYITAELEPGVELKSVEIISYIKPLVDENHSSNKTLTREDYNRMATKNINSVAAQSAGVYQFSRLGDMFVRGGRSESSETFIDGMRVIGSSGFPQSAIVQINSIDIGGKPASLGDVKSDKTEILDAIDVADINSKSIRDNFVDYAFWQPDLVSDENGKASFEVTFPDNITEWKTFVVGMNNKKFTGSASSTVKAYKKIMAQLETPRFLIENDETNVVGKLFNVTNINYPVHTKFSMNKLAIQQTDTFLVKSLVQYQKLTAVDDTLQVQFECTLQNGYSDGELQKIPVFKKGLNEKSGTFLNLCSDSIYQIQLNQNLNSHVISIYNNPIHFVMKDLQALQNYYYSCNEQMASKLKAYLLEEIIKKQTGEKFKKKKEINQLIKKLELNQHPDGYWGWWNQSEYAVNWISLHVISALNMAKSEGYYSQALEKAERYLQISKYELAPIDLLETYSLLCDMKVNINHDEWISAIKKDKITSQKYDKLYTYFVLQKGLQAANSRANTDSILKLKKTTYTGDIYWESDTIVNWRHNSIVLTLMAYQILKNDSGSRQNLSAISAYLLQKRNFEGGWNNTFITANVLACILPDLVKSKNDLQVNQIKLIEDGRSQTIKDFPFVKEITAKSIGIQKQGIYPAFVNLYEQNWNSSPKVKSNDFKIETYFVNKNGKITTFKRGESLTLITTIQVFKKADFVKLEIPIPAGCVYSDFQATKNYAESHREQFKNKTVVFFDQLKPGNYEIRINLDVRYAGKYSLNPAQIELMYLPLTNGNNEVKVVEINND